MLDRCIDFLDRQGVPYSHATHPSALTAPQIASAERMPAHSFVKTVVYRDTAGYGMAVVPEDCTVDLEKVAAAMGRAEIRPATEQEMAEICPEIEAGAMPPFGNLWGLPVLVDAQVASHPILVFYAGTRHDVIRMTFADFRRLVNPLIASFLAPEETAPIRPVRAMRSRAAVRCRRNPRS